MAGKGGDANFGKPAPLEGQQPSEKTHPIDNLNAARIPDAGDNKGFKFTDAQVKSLQDGIAESTKGLQASMANIGNCFAALSRPDSNGQTVDGKAAAADWMKAVNERSPGKVDANLMQYVTGDRQS